ncbi:MAG: replicative DNA helicase [Flavobacterium sp.]|nr:replicative DNA helicase [Flavobacterium sp.]
MNEYVVPPHDDEMEELVIGALLIEPEAYDCVSFLHPDVFYDHRNKTIYEAIQSLKADFKPVDRVTVWKYLHIKKMTDHAGGIEWFSQRSSRIGSAANIEEHARIIYQFWILRELIITWGKLSAKAYRPETDVFDLLHESGEVVFRIQDGLHGNKKASNMVSLINTERDRYSAIQIANAEGRSIGVETGYSDLNNMTKGWQPSDLVIIAARPAMGKTSLVLSFARHAKCPVAFFSLEMSELQLIQRLVVMESEIDSHRYKTATLGNGEIDELETHRKSMQSLPIYIDDTPALSVIDLRAKARRMKQQYGIELIIIDYLQLMTTGRKERGNREQEISFISRMLKVIAKELNIPVIALSQLSRASEARPDKKPLLSDLRESGAIEQDADMVIFVHRPEYYGMENEGDTNAQLIVAKHRNGDTGIINLNWIGELTKFTDPKKTYKPSSGISPNTDFYKQNNNDPF